MPNLTPPSSCLPWSLERVRRSMATLVTMILMISLIIQLLHRMATQSPLVARLYARHLDSAAPPPAELPEAGGVLEALGDIFADLRASVRGTLSHVTHSTTHAVRRTLGARRTCAERPQLAVRLVAQLSDVVVAQTLERGRAARATLAARARSP